MDPQKLLLTTDLSEESLRPFQAVATLARQLGLAVTLLHVVEDLAVAPHGAPLAPPLHSLNLADEMERAREVLAARRTMLGPEIDVETVVISAPGVANAIVEYAEEHGYGLIALSSHGRTGFRRMVMGSVVEHVLRRTHVPVLVFPRRE
ncbi:MAG: universal stress protein [Planctomycetota bacterium]